MNYQGRKNMKEKYKVKAHIDYNSHITELEKDK
jgi:hypothetical protein